MKEVAAFVAMEVTPEEMEEVIKRRELAVKNAAIKEKTQVLAQTIKGIESLGGRVRVTRDRKNTYFSSYGENIVDVRHSNPRFVEIVIT
jgi:hypothetical protein